MTDLSVSNVEHSASLHISAQIEQIHGAWELFPPDGIKLLELRAIDPFASMPTRVEHFKANSYHSLNSLKGAFARRASEMNQAGYNIYTTLNPIRPDLCSAAAKDADVLYRRLLLIDIDRVSNTKQPATDAELNAAQTLAEAISDFLNENGWPSPKRLMSGNGFHLYYPLHDLPNTDAVTASSKVY